ncbi:DMT family transporter [Jannaschia seohaensis]|uniref:Transporter family-2 protein n=1 Tax=Jannaschia seohaensis TaxID=475081 RepID=A0A2Y9A2P6_9RHOB|nr:DMT family transporter [Jannaschia seohaensis]PWJ21599.1 transporter family-2 protein [Jannaschia seohaensis]SSA36799.1 transporter family-2 protein [Jannaschia seohaensis]
MQATLFVSAALAVLGGMLVAAQGPIYARFSLGLGRDHLLAVFLAFATATLVTGLFAFVSGSLRALTVVTVLSLPWWVWLGGLLGVVHVVISMQTIPMLGATLFLVLVITGSLLGGALYDHFGAIGLAERPFSTTKAFGLAMVIVGVSIVASA